MFWVFGVCPSLTSLGHLPEAWGFCVCEVMMIWFRSFILNYGNVSGMFYDVSWSIDCYCFPVFSCETEVKGVWVFDQLYLDCFPVTFIGLRCLVWFILSDVMLWHIWLNHFESLINIICMLSSCSWRIDGYCDLSLMLSSCSQRIDVIIVDYLWCFPVTCLGLRWSVWVLIYDFISVH